MRCTCLKPRDGLTDSGSTVSRMVSGMERRRTRAAYGIIAVAGGWIALMVGVALGTPEGGRGGAGAASGIAGVVLVVGAVAGVLARRRGSAGRRAAATGVVVAAGAAVTAVVTTVVLITWVL